MMFSHKRKPYCLILVLLLYKMCVINNHIAYSYVRTLFFTDMCVQRTKTKEAEVYNIMHGYLKKSVDRKLVVACDGFSVLMAFQPRCKL